MPLATADDFQSLPLKLMTPLLLTDKGLYLGGVRGKLTICVTSRELLSMVPQKFEPFIFKVNYSTFKVMNYFLSAGKLKNGHESLVCM